jgi:hypothetical protein
MQVEPKSEDYCTRIRIFFGALSAWTCLCPGKLSKWYSLNFLKLHSKPFTPNSYTACSYKQDFL